MNKNKMLKQDIMCHIILVVNQTQMGDIYNEKCYT